MSTKYEVIINYIKTEIENGNFKAKLPSIRALAIKFNCSNSTVIRAYSELEKQNLIYALPKSGYFVVENQLNCCNFSDNEVINFYSGEPDNSVLPYEDFQDCINTAISQYKQNLFSYSLTSGFTPLKQTIYNMLRKNNLNVSMERLFITSGTQSALSLLSFMPFINNKKSILVEQPSYNIFLKWLTTNNFDIIGIERDFNGIDLNKLEQIFKTKDIKFFYTMPRLQNPLGTSYSEEQKKEILYLANKYDVYIVEDDYLSDLNDSNCMPLSYYDTYERVIYIKSFSKVLMPGLRISACLMPESMADTFDNYKASLDLVTSVPLQGALNVYINNGCYSNYTSTLKKFYGSRMKLLKSQFEKFRKFDLEYEVPNNGLFAFLKFKHEVNVEELINTMLSKDVELRTGSHFFIKDFYSYSSLRFSISKTNEDKIIKGMDMLYKEMDNFTNSLYLRKSNLLEV